MKPTPIYMQIVEHIKSKIVSGEYAINDQLPTEMELANQFKTSRPTVVKALDKLLTLGIIYKIQGKGSFVNPNYQNTMIQNSNIASLIMPFADYRRSNRSDELNIIKGIESKLSKHDYYLMIHYCKNTETDFLAAMRKVKTSMSKGTIAYVAQNLNNTEEIFDIFLDNQPVVLLDKSILGTNLPCVKVDNTKGALLGTKHLVDCHYDVIYFLSDLNMTLNESVRERYWGFRKISVSNEGKAQFEHLFFNDDNQSLSNEMITESLSDIVKQHEGKRIGFLCVSDYFAYRVCNAVQSLGISMPEQVGVVGFDGLDMPLPNHKYLTTIQHDFFGIGENAAELMIKTVKNVNLPAQIIITDVKLKVRDTTIDF